MNFRQARCTSLDPITGDVEAATEMLLNLTDLTTTAVRLAIEKHRLIIDFMTPSDDLIAH